MTGVILFGCGAGCGFLLGKYPGAAAKIGAAALAAGAFAWDKLAPMFGLGG